MSAKSEAKPLPPYRRILGDLEARISRSELLPGDALPTRANLAVEYDAARATVDKALSELVRKGLVSAGSGRRTVVLPVRAPAQPVIAVLWNWTPDQESQGRDFLDLMFRGVREACAEYHLQVHFRSTPLHSYEEVIRSTGAHGILVVRPDFADIPTINRIHKSGVATVVVPGVLEGADVPSVAADNAAGIGAAIDHLVELGHRDIGFLGVTTTVPDHFERLQGYLSAMAHHRLTVRPEWLRLGHEISPARFGGAIHNWLSPTQHPTAVVSCDFLMTLSLLGHLKDQGLAVPTDVSVVTFDDPPAAAQLHPPLTAVYQPVPRLGYRAIQRLMELTAGVSGPPADRIETRLIIRGSTAPARP